MPISCLSILLVSLEDLTSLVDQSLPVDVIYIDFGKAFFGWYSLITRHDLAISETMLSTRFECNPESESTR